MRRAFVRGWAKQRARFMVQNKGDDDTRRGVVSYKKRVYNQIC